LLIDFIINGSEEQVPYGLNGFGSGRMPAFGAILDANDIDLLARYLRSGDLTGMGEEQMFREFFRSLLSGNVFVTGILLTVASVLLFYGSIYLFNLTNLGKRLGFLVTGAAVFGWLTITSMLFVIYAPRGPQPRGGIEGLNAFEIRILPITYLL